MLDVRNFADGSTTGFDAIEFPPPGISSRAWNQGGVGAPFGIADSWALVTQFTFGPGQQPPPPPAGVPEPGTVALFATGLLSLLVARRRWRPLNYSNRRP